MTVRYTTAHLLWDIDLPLTPVYDQETTADFVRFGTNL